MSEKQTEKQNEAEAFAFAQKGIEAGAEERYAEAAEHWRAASDHADSHLEGADIYYWIKSGYGSALYDIGAYEESIAVSRVALDWCSSHRKPLPAISMARSYRRLGDHAAAAVYLEKARTLVGDPELEIWDDI